MLNTFSLKLLLVDDPADALRKELEQAITLATTLAERAESRSQAPCAERILVTKLGRAHAWLVRTQDELANLRRLTG